MVLSSYVGATVKRKEDPRLITGSSTYVDDLKLAGTVHVAFVRSPYAHARINGIDTAAAKAAPGVVAVWTADDLSRVLKDKYPITPYGETGAEGGEDIAEEEGIPVPHVEPLAMTKVRFVGETVVAVAAETRAQAEDAAALVEVDYEPLDAVIDPYEAR
ncbi:MAG TPA: xanthine dehydrogenase family protein molybdopterin-binding subunit, partial [Thermomicrobiales bacterium]|nr:xanthine dehydrogenase family protein molybdopterin-binding subunit [Thermomicrobiales bacterium]